MAELLGELLASLLIVAGSFFLLVGSWGLVKLPTLMQRLHAPTKSTTLGAGGLLLGSMAYFGLVEGTFSFHELLVSLFLFLTAPITAHMLAKANILRDRGVASRLPPTGRSVGWATLERGEEERQVS